MTQIITIKQEIPCKKKVKFYITASPVIITFLLYIFGGFIFAAGDSRVKDVDPKRMKVYESSNYTSGLKFIRLDCSQIARDGNFMKNTHFLEFAVPSYHKVVVYKVKKKDHLYIIESRYYKLKPGGGSTPVMK